MANRQFALVLHDISPETWVDYAPFVAAIDKLAKTLGPIPITWLVVPNFHGRGECKESKELRGVLDQRLAIGDELTLHGYYHRDDAPKPKTLRDYYMRRIYTWEGEFYALSTNQAGDLLDSGIHQFEQCGWPTNGFVAPAWLMSEGTRQALAERPFNYTSIPSHLLPLPSFNNVAAPTIVISARSAWRRQASKVVSSMQEKRAQDSPFIRLALHPVDLRYESSFNYWLNLVTKLMQNGRTPATKLDWLKQQQLLERTISGHKDVVSA